MYQMTSTIIILALEGQYLGVNFVYPPIHELNILWCTSTNLEAQKYICLKVAQLKFSLCNVCRRLMKNVYMSSLHTYQILLNLHFWSRLKRLLLHVAGLSNLSPLFSMSTICFPSLFAYGSLPYVRISHTVTPKLQTSDMCVYSNRNMLSGAIQRNGT